MPKLCFMNLDQLQALRAIADEGSFEAAAYELGVSASAVSQRIRALEREVGQVLLRRGEVLAAVTTEPQPVQGARQSRWGARATSRSPRPPCSRGTRRATSSTSARCP